MLSSTKAGLAAAAGIAAALILAGAALVGGESANPPTHPSSAAVIGPLLPGEVCEGELSSLDAVESTLPFPLAFPNASLASDSNLKSVWQCNEMQMALQYDSGVVVYESVNTLKDPEAEWKSMAATYPEFSVGVVNGVPASLADPTIGSGTRGGVDFVVNGVRVTVSGNGEIPLTDLVDVADSISFSASPTVAPK